jgi:hypothetical protein
MDALGGLVLALFFLLVVVFALFLIIPLVVDWTV